MEKSFSSIEIKSLQDDKREIEGIASTPAVDRVNDIVEPMGLSFQREAPLLLNHDHSQPVGTVQFGRPTAKGLPFRAKIAKVAEAGAVKDRCDEAWHSVKNGLIKGVSIGFRPLESKPLNNGGTRFTKSDVHELSLVAVPANPEATITAFKSADTKTTITKDTHMQKNTVADQIRKALSMTHAEAVIASTVEKNAVPAAMATGSPLVYPSQQSGITPLTPQVTRSLIQMLADLGAPQLPPNRRALTQPANLTAVELNEGDMVPGAAPGSAFVLSGMRRFGLLVAFNDELLAFGNDAVIAWVEAVLTNAANNATDTAVIAAMQAAAGAPVSTIMLADTGVTSRATAIGAAFDAFTADLRTACWIGNPATLGKLQDAANPNIGPRGGTYRTLPALPVLAAPAGTLFLMDAARTAVYDGPQLVERSSEASVILDSDPAHSSLAPVNLFESHMTA
ncbi:MAG: HK97 family phage prohead protease, partial [Cupriavidus sp.]|nr:HK97 family phage prohead protease [Cupriavidus sp.]